MERVRQKRRRNERGEENILFCIYLLKGYDSMESSDEEMASQLAKKKKRVEGSAEGKAKKAEPKRKRWRKYFCITGILLMKRSSVDSLDEDSDEVAIQPAKPAVGKKKLSKSMKPASPPKAKKAMKYESDDMMDYDDLPKGPPRSRVARGAVKKYVEVLSSDGEEEGSMFVEE